MKNMGHI